MNFQRLVQNMPESVLVTDAKGTIEFVNPAFAKVTGYSSEEIIGKNPNILKSGRQNLQFYQNMWIAIAKDSHWQGEIWNKELKVQFCWGFFEHLLAFILIWICKWLLLLVFLLACHLLYLVTSDNRQNRRNGN